MIKEMRISPSLSRSNYFAHTDYTRSLNFPPAGGLNVTIIHVCLLKAQLKSLFVDLVLLLLPTTTTHIRTRHHPIVCRPELQQLLRSSYADQQLNRAAGNLKSNSRRSKICVSKGDRRRIAVHGRHCSRGGKKRSISSLLNIFFLFLHRLQMSICELHAFAFRAFKYTTLQKKFL